MCSTPSAFTQPLMTSSPGRTVRGRLSPVRAAVFRVDSPVRTTPSSGIFSPGLTTMVAPMGTSSGVNDGDAAVPGLQIRAVGANVHQRGDARTALADGVGLEQLADLVEQHNRDRFVIIAAF